MKSVLRSVLVLAVAAGSARAASFTSIVSFGDSLSDVGNFKSASFGLAPGAPGYYNGHFSNGQIWVEQLAPKLGVPVPTASTAGGTDYAYGDALSGTGTTSINGLFTVPNLRTQINNYTGAHAGGSTQLYTVLGGANDLFAALQTTGLTSAQRAAVAQAAAANVAAGVNDLYTDGGRNVLVANLPDLGNIPKYNQTAQKADATSVTQAFNTALSTDLAAVKAASPGLNLYSLDLAGLFSAALADKAAFGLTNVTDANYTNDPNYLGIGTSAGDASGYLFYDDAHPTTVGHGIVAATALAAVPEPGMVALCVAALPLLRRRRA